MNVHEIQSQMTDLRHVQSHLGACTTSGKTPEEIAHIDERFFLACEDLSVLKARLNQPVKSKRGK